MLSWGISGHSAMKQFRQTCMPFVLLIQTVLRLNAPLIFVHHQIQYAPKQYTCVFIKEFYSFCIILHHQMTFGLIHVYELLHIFMSGPFYSRLYGIRFFLIVESRTLSRCMLFLGSILFELWCVVVSFALIPLLLILILYSSIKHYKVYP